MASFVCCNNVESPKGDPPVQTAAATAAPTTTQAPVAAPNGEYTFDGFELGTNFATVMARAPYDKPCDNDPVAKKSRRMMLYGSKPCRGNSFPEKTAVIFLLAFSEQDKYAQPIEALVWMGGSYYEKRSNFAAKTGSTVADVESKLGPSAKELTVEDGNLGRHGRRTNEGVTLTIRQHPKQVRSISDGDTVIGFVVGPMPDDAQNEQWRMIAQIYRRYVREQ
jgi:hypothetical protein